MPKPAIKAEERDGLTESVLELGMLLRRTAILLKRHLHSADADEWEWQVDAAVKAIEARLGGGA
jgi:hypothetical protein